MELQGKRILLRSVNIGDVQTILRWENDPKLRAFSDPHPDYTEQQIVRFVVNQQFGFEANGQLRLMIVARGRVVGAIDLFDYDGKRAEIGILIYNIFDRRHGYATEAIELVKTLAPQLGITTLLAVVSQTNRASAALFQRCGFIEIEKNRYIYETNSCSINTFSRLR